MGGLCVPADVHRADDPTRNRPVRPPSRQLPCWLVDIDAGCYDRFDAIAIADAASAYPTCMWGRLVLLALDRCPRARGGASPRSAVPPSGEPAHAKGDGLPADPAQRGTSADVAGGDPSHAAAASVSAASIPPPAEASTAGRSPLNSTLGLGGAGLPSSVRADVGDSTAPGGDTLAAEPLPGNLAQRRPADVAGSAAASATSGPRSKGSLRRGANPGTLETSDPSASLPFRHSARSTRLGRPGARSSLAS